jgi:hypothetical protein
LFDQKDYEKFDGNTEVVATINDSETGNDVIEGRQPTGVPPSLQTGSLRLWVAEIALTRS